MGSRFLDTSENRSRMVLNVLSAEHDHLSSSVQSTTEAPTEHTDATDMMAYLPWATQKLGLDLVLDLVKVMLTEHHTKKTDSPIKSRKFSKFQKPIVSVSQISNISKEVEPTEEEKNMIINIILYYARPGVLTHIKINNAKQVPRSLIRVISLVVQFYPDLCGFNINSGADQYTIYELARLIPLSHLTEICLDNIFIPQANFSILLDQPNNLSVISFSRCKMGDEAFINICRKLEHPEPASHTIYSLTASSNHLTDESAKAIAKVLRSNRSLLYLNLADNYITDEGAEAIFNDLKQFPLTPEEGSVVAKRHKELMLLKLVKINEQNWSNISSASTKRITMKRHSSVGKAKTTVKRRDTVQRADSIPQDANAAMTTSKRILNFEKLNQFLQDCFVESGQFHNKGNNTLTCLSLAYNNLTYMSLQSLVKVLHYQRLSQRKPPGLIKVNIEGNPMPVSCDELQEIDMYFKTFLPSETRVKRKSFYTPRSDKSQYSQSN